MPGLLFRRTKSWRGGHLRGDSSIALQMVGCSSQHSFFLRAKRHPKKTLLREDGQRRGSFGREMRGSCESLEHILSDKLLCTLFHDWAVENVCSENLHFYHEVEKYTTILDPDFRKQEAYRIYGKFIQARAAAQVNLDYECQRAIEAELDHPTPTTFEEAKYVVLDLMRFDLYLKFLGSNLYRNFKGLPCLNLSSPKKQANFQIAAQPHLSFDQISTLTRCLEDPMALDEFLKFTCKEFSNEVVQLYLDINRYEASPALGAASEIYNKYLSGEADEEVDADPKIKLCILQQIEMGICPMDLFHTLKVQVYAVMVQDNFLRFQNYVISSLALC